MIIYFLKSCNEGSVSDSAEGSSIPNKYIGDSHNISADLKKQNDDFQIVSEIKSIIQEYPNYGCQMIGLKLRQTRKINHKREE